MASAMASISVIVGMHVVAGVEFRAQFLGVCGISTRASKSITASNAPPAANPLVHCLADGLPVFG